jgi:hypothetical protein
MATITFKCNEIKIDDVELAEDQAVEIDLEDKSGYYIRHGHLVDQGMNFTKQYGDGPRIINLPSTRPEPGSIAMNVLVDNSDRTVGFGDLVDNQFGEINASRAEIAVCRDRRHIRWIETAWSGFRYSYHGDGEWSYEGAIQGFLKQNLIPKQLKADEILEVEGSYGYFTGPDALEKYQEVKTKRSSAQFEIDNIVGHALGHAPDADLDNPRTQPALLPNVIRKEQGSIDSKELEKLISATMKRLYPDGVRRVDTRKLSTDDQDALADEFESWVKYDEPLTKGGNAGYLAGTPMLRVGPPDTGIMYSFEFSHRQHYTEKLQEQMARFYIDCKTPSGGFWKRAHRMVDLAEAKRRRHDMHNGLPEWAIPETHMRDECGEVAAERAEMYCGLRPTNKMVAWAGMGYWNGEKCHIYVYHYDGMYLGRFMAKRKPIPTTKQTPKKKKEKVS